MKKSYIWKLKPNMKNIITINEEGKILCILEFENNMLLSGTDKNNINLWDLINLKLSFSFKGHKSWVNDLTKINNTFFASCSNDRQIIIWDYQNKTCKHILKGHLDGVLSLITLSNIFRCILNLKE